MIFAGNNMLEKIYGAVDFAAAAILLFGGVPAPAVLIYALALVLVIKGMMSFAPLPVYMPSLLMCGTDILAAGILLFSGVGLIKAAVIFILLFKAVPGLIFSVLGK